MTLLDNESLTITPMALGIDGQRVVLTFPEPQTTVVFDPPAAVAVAEKLTDLAFEADTSLKPIGDTLKASMVEKHRLVLTQRFTHVIRSMRTNKSRTHEQMAKELIDVAFKEIF